MSTALDAATSCARCHASLQPRGLQYECVNPRCDFCGKRLCAACTTIEPHVGKYTRALDPTWKWNVLVGAVAFGVAMGIILFRRREAGVAGAIVSGMLIAVAFFLVMALQDMKYSMWWPREHQHFSLWQGEVETTTITDDVPKFVACAGCGHPVIVPEDVSEDAKARARGRLHVTD